MRKINHEKMDFSRTIQYLSGDCHNHGDCHTYGIVSGCDSGCPALWNGECEVIDENIELLNLEEEELEKLRDIYYNLPRAEAK